MDNKISTAGLAAMLALATGKQKQLCEDFVRELFSIVENELAKGENVRIKGFGTFKLVEVEPRKSVNVVTGENYEIPGHTKIVFVMAKELASVVNAPFNAFEAVEIADAIPTDVLDGFAEVPEEDVSDALYNINAQEEYNNIVPDEETGDEGVAEPKGSVEDLVLFNDNDTNKKSFWKRYQFIIGIFVGICASVLFGWICLRHTGLINPSSSQIEDIAMEDDFEVINMAAPVDTLSTLPGDGLNDDDVPTLPSDSPVYDTVSTTRYLTTIAKEHYGNFNLWPIIYEENSAFLGHPDRITPGTRVIVPPLSKYNVNPNDKDQINAMKQKGKEIYDKFK